MKIFWLFVLSLCLCCYFPAQAQFSKDSLIKEAKQYFAASEYADAYPLFKRIFEDTTGVQGYLYYFGIVCAVKSNDNNQAFIWLKNYIDAVQNPQFNFYRLQYNLWDLYKDPRWDTFLTLMQKKAGRYDHQMKYKVDLKKQLDDLFYEDQKYRILIAPYEKIYGDSSLITKKLWYNIEFQDSINLKTFTKLFNKYGWLNKKEVGSSAVAQWTIIQHANLTIQKKYLPLLKQAMESGDIRKESLALTIDRIKIGEGKEQIYGSQIGRIKVDGKFINFIKPLEDPDHVDKRRKDMDMVPIKKYVERFGINWNLLAYKRNIHKYQEIEKASH